MIALPRAPCRHIARVCRRVDPMAREAVASRMVFLGLALVIAPSLLRGADADRLINPDLAFRDTILEQPAPANIKALITEGNATITFMPDLGDAAAKTHYFFESDWSFDYQYTIAAQSERRVMRLTASNIRLDTKIRHVVRMPVAHYHQDVWRSQLLRHEFDHVAISTDPRPQELLKQLCQRIPPIEHVMETAAKPSKELCLELINQELRRRETAVSEIVRGNYELLDEVSRHGMVPIPERGAFFGRLYTRANLEAHKFPFAAEVADLLETPAYRQIRPRHLPTDPARTVP